MNPLAIPALDHVVIDVRTELDAAAAQYRRLGFQLTARGHHTLGSANHLAIFQTNYLELLAMGLPGGPSRQELEPFPPGLNGLVLATADADADYRAFSSRGVAMRAPQSFSRPVELPEGIQDARFRTTHVMSSEVPFGRLYVCQHDTPELVWRDAWRDHPNGAEEIVQILIAAAAPAATAALFVRLFDGPASPIDDAGTLRVMAGGVTIDIQTPASVANELGAACPEPAGRASFVAALRLRTRSRAQTAAALAPLGVLPANDTRLLVPAQAAGNVALEFVE
jgi:hypothetical protein